MRYLRHRPAPFGTAIVCLVLLLAFGVTLARAQDGSPPTDTLAASLLTAEDLPGFTGRDLDPTELDIDRRSFDEQRGIETRIRAWVAQERGVVFDHRMLFPDSEAALAYLTAAEPTLSEADDAGLVLVADDPLTAATRHWAGETRIGADVVAMDVWLVPVGPVVAKVAVTVFGPGLDERRIIAERALARLEAAYGPADGALRSPEGSLAVPPGASPDASAVSPSASAVSDIERLQGLVQAVLRTGARGCGDAGPSLPGEVVAMSCTKGDIVVVYRQFTDDAARDAAFASLVEQVPEPDGGAISCADGAYQGSVTEGDRTWAVACWESSSGLVLLWTEPHQPTLGAILAPPFSDLVGAWEAARFLPPLD